MILRLVFDVIKTEQTYIRIGIDGATTGKRKGKVQRIADTQG
jgi:hypothetical protein